MNVESIAKKRQRSYDFEDHMLLPARRINKKTLDSVVLDMCGSFINTDSLQDYELKVCFKGSKSNGVVHFQDVNVAKV